MAGTSLEWWEQDTEKDQLLLKLIEEVKQLGHLPEVGMGLAYTKFPCRNPYITYFCSVEEAYEEVARILFGHGDLTAPDDLLPRERELLEEEQMKILAERHRIYLERLQELETPGTLRRWRVDEAKKRYERKVPKGHEVRQIPEGRRSRKKRIAGEPMLYTATLYDEPPRRATEPVLSSAKPVTEKPVAESQKPAAKAQKPKDKLSWDAMAQLLLMRKFQGDERDEGQDEKQREDDDQDVVVTRQESQAQEVEQPQEPSREQDNVRKDVKDVKRPRRSKQQLLETLYEMTKHFGKIPSDAQISIYAAGLRDDQQVASKMTFQRHLGKRSTWEQQLSEYVRENGLEPIEALVVPPGEEVVPVLEPEAGSGPELEPEVVPEPEAPEVNTDEGVKTKKMKLNLMGFTLRFEFGGQDYEVEVEFGAADDGAKDTS